MKGLKAEVKIQAKDICGNEAFRIFQCNINRYHWKGDCLVKCSENTGEQLAGKNSSSKTRNAASKQTDDLEGDL
jgi:hypothetical protein